MKILHVDAFSGAAGDMLLAALADLGFDAGELAPILEALHLPPEALRIGRVRRGALACSKVDLDIPKDHGPHHRHLSDLVKLIESLPYPEAVRNSAVKTFRNLGEAEAKIHGVAVEQVHFHEVGASDSTIDIVGVCLAVHRLGVERITCSPLPTGRGFVECDHGTLPLPAPAALELLKGIPTEPARREGEHVTPTAAALLKTLVNEFGDMPGGVIERVGYGAGSRIDPTGPPNALRCVLLEDANAGYEAGGTLMAEADIDDMNPQLYPVVLAALAEAGALDASLHPCVMKQGRPGVTVRITVKPDRLDDVAAALFRESTTIGLRYWPLQRIVGERTFEKVSTRFGEITIKVSRHRGRIVNAHPEFRECEAAARAHGAPVKLVMQEASAVWRREQDHKTD